MHLQQHGSRSIHLRKRDHIQVYRGGQLAMDGICRELSSVVLVSFLLYLPFLELRERHSYLL